MPRPRKTIPAADLHSPSRVASFLHGMPQAAAFALLDASKIVEHGYWTDGRARRWDVAREEWVEIFGSGPYRHASWDKGEALFFSENGQGWSWETATYMDADEERDLPAGWVFGLAPTEEADRHR